MKNNSLDSGSSQQVRIWVNVDNAEYKLTNKGLEALQATGVPAEVLAKLKTWKRERNLRNSEIEFERQGDFLKELSTRLTKPELELYQAAILRQADVTALQDPRRNLGIAAARCRRRGRGLVEAVHFDGETRIHAGTIRRGVGQDAHQGRTGKDRGGSVRRCPARTIFCVVHDLRQYCHDRRAAGESVMRLMVSRDAVAERGSARDSRQRRALPRFAIASRLTRFLVRTH